MVIVLFNDSRNVWEMTLWPNFLSLIASTVTELVVLEETNLCVAKILIRFLFLYTNQRFSWCKFFVHCSSKWRPPPSKTICGCIIVDAIPKSKSLKNILTKMVCSWKNCEHFVISISMHNTRWFTHIMSKYRLWQGRQLGCYHFQHNYNLLKHKLLHQTEVRPYMRMMAILWSIVCDIWEMRSSWMSSPTPTSAPSSQTVLVMMGPRYRGYPVISRVWRICNIKCCGHP